MIVELEDILQDSGLRATFVRRGVELVDAEVAKKGGFGGMALKAGYAAVKNLRPGITAAALDGLLPHFLPAVAGHVAAGRAGGDLAGYFVKQAGPIAEALLSVTDDKVGRNPNPVVSKTYGALRGQAKAHTQEAVPGVGRILADMLK